MEISSPIHIRFPQPAALFILCTAFFASPAHAQAIKMLPPTNCPFVTQAQINAGASNVWGVLGWDSKNPLSCVPNFQFSDNGYTGIGSAGAQPQALLDLYGDYDYSYPTPGLSHLGNLHMDPTDNIAPTNDGWGTAITFGGDNGYDASAEAGIYVQYSNAIYANGSPGTKMYFGTSDSYPTGAQIRMTIDNLGNVGIGTTNPVVALDVTGGVRAGSSTAVTTCGSGPANGEGTQRYNYTSHQMEFCNGTVWIALNDPLASMKAAMGVQNFPDDVVCTQGPPADDDGVYSMAAVQPVAMPDFCSRAGVAYAYPSGTSSEAILYSYTGAFEAYYLNGTCTYSNVRSGSDGTVTCPAQLSLDGRLTQGP